ncbi:MAG: hypothetical protein IK108_08780 [Clostridia bacterium]|nr:hypothetical protein [Clostridia bacterium]
MTRTVKRLFACVLALAMLFSIVLPGLAKTGPYKPEEGGWEYARLEFVELDENGEPIEVINEEYGYPDQKTLPLYASGKAFAQEGAVYDPASNTLTITDLQANYKLRAVLMGDDFTLCVKGDCRLAGVEAHGGGVMYPKWGCGLRFTGDGSLTLNADQKLESGILIAPQEEAAFFLTVDPEVTLTVGGSKTAIEAWGFTGAFTLTVDGEEASIKAQPAVRTVNMQLRGYSNPSKTNLRMCDNSSDPEGIYQISEWFHGDDPAGVTVQRYIYISSIDAYVEDHDWAQSHATDEHGNEVSYETLADAAAWGFTPRKNGEGEDVWLDDVTVYWNYNDEDVCEDAEGNRYVVGSGTNDVGEYGTYAYTAQELAELPGEYVFMYAAGVDPETLTPVMEDRVFEGQYDWFYPEKTYSHKGSTPDKYKVIDRIDVTLDESAFPWDEEITPEAMFTLLLDDLFTVTTKGVGLRFRRVTESGTGKYQTLPITASKLFSDNPFTMFAGDKEYALELTFYDNIIVDGKETVFADSVDLYVNGKKVSSGAPLTADVSEMIVAGDLVLDAGTYKKPADTPKVMLGDVDKDKNITASDARLALRRAVDLEDYAEGSYEFIACDVDKDGKVTANDARSILRAAVDLEDPATW